LRQQALQNDIKRIDAVLYTHEHADHVNGLDDLRSFNFLLNDAIPIWSNQVTLDVLTQRFSYAFLPKPDIFWYRPCLLPNLIPDTDIHNFNVFDIPITSFKQFHGSVKPGTLKPNEITLGYRIGNFAYSTDVHIMPEIGFEALKGTEIWIVDCLRRKQTFTHSHLEQTLQWIGRIKPKLAVLTHMDHDFDYDSFSSELPSGVILAFDGMIIDV
jgi:phosphoribosyl 1,2-cyclic phosphate phosphodiesterase